MSSLNCAQPSTYRVIPRFRKKTSPKKVIPRLRSNRQGIYELILSCHSDLFFLSVTPASFFYCHSGLRAGVQVNIDSLTAWIPGQARNDKYIKVIPRFRKKTSRDLRISPFLNCKHSVVGDAHYTIFYKSSAGEISRVISRGEENPSVYRNTCSR